MDTIKIKLEKLYSSFDFDSAIKRDPIRFPKRYSHPLDIEVVGIIASFFAYGSIKCFCNFLDRLFSFMGENPADFILNFKPSNLLERLEIKYRFSNIEDIVAFLFILQNLLKNAPSLENYFRNKNSSSIIFKISNFIEKCLEVDLKPIYGRDIKTRGLLHFFPHPNRGSACKRINLYLRWMVRKRDIDFGIWKTIKPIELIIPLDVHIWRISQKLGFTTRNSPNLKSAQEITNFLRKIEPNDPLKYDFVLCHGDINSLI